MSVIPSAKRAIRIIALPLATPSAHKSRGLVEHLTYYHFVTPPPSEGNARNWLTWVQNKAADMWAGMGKAPEGNWRRKSFLYGERLVDRLDFEELALKSFDTSLGPKLLPTGRKDRIKPTDNPTIPLIYPSSACESPLPHLHTLLEKRTPSHRKGAIIWLAISPLTAPFMIIPIIPNFPFFFCAWRAWSHYRAFKASQYLESFVERGAILPQASPELDAIYAEYAPVPPDPEAPGTPHPGSHYSTPKEGAKEGDDVDVEASETPDSAASMSKEKLDAAGPDRPHLLLTRAAVPALEKFLGLPPGGSFASDVYRALEQARLRLEREGR
ncbi:mitochondrial K+-H+ exchange-related-domain-containing protein [Rhodofomes roseus]|uniref:Mitochondrial K+-H+ exchange-related-domain-containing protein n=1 Tax=Rhodofomes roseus TaxID=34475 RepID=A0ABQ8KTP2_9APHY|nr:mitochondrial K+-H+ exchange-related-domain-containing protein [Rhodofomes roseus]KAH9841924.1 mitochondrial K+-H+ exchange-related-domain-containing protein [Rhodofomes roseus]